MTNNDTALQILTDLKTWMPEPQTPVLDPKTEVPDLWSGGIRLDLTPVHKFCAYVLQIFNIFSKKNQTATKQKSKTQVNA